MPIRHFNLNRKVAAAIVSLACLAMIRPACNRAATLQDRYTFSPSDTSAKGGVLDSVGKYNGTAIGKITFSASGAEFGGGASGKSPSYISLPREAVIGLSNATIEIFTTSFTPSADYEALFDVSTEYTVGNGIADTYSILIGNRNANPAGIGVALCMSGQGETGNVGNGGPNLSSGSHLVSEVFSSFTSLGQGGILTLYVDGKQIAQGVTRDSFMYLSTGAPGIQTVGIGGGSPYPDPTFEGGMSEVRIWDGALTPDQVLADYQAGPTKIAVAAQ